MNILESLDARMAASNLDIAAGILGKLVRKEVDKKADAVISRAYQCCTYSRFVHMNVWKDLTSREEVKRKLIPLLESAGNHVAALKKEKYLNEDQVGKVAYCADNICLRLDNLRNNYIKGRPSEFPPDMIEFRREQ
jgi:hypothetical protein